jgi:hypothetical protein
MRWGSRRVRHVPNQARPTGDHPFVSTLGAQPVDLFRVRVEAYLQLTGTRLPLWFPPAWRSDINGDASLYGCGIGDDLTELFDLEFELREPSVQEVFTKPMSDVDDPHRRFPWGSGKVERPYYGSQLFVNKFGGYGASTVDPTF